MTGLLAFQYGPNHFCTEQIAAEKGYKRWVKGAPVSQPDPARAKAARAASAVPPPAPRPSARPKMPPPPGSSSTSPVHMRWDEMQAERARLEKWMVDVAAFDMNEAETATYNEVKYRADWLYVLEMMAR